jgi:hypothetical protein
MANSHRNTRLGTDILEVAAAVKSHPDTEAASA